MSHDDYVFIRLSLEGFLESEHIPSLQAIKGRFLPAFLRVALRPAQEGQLAGEINPDLNFI